MSLIFVRIIKNPLPLKGGTLSSEIQLHFAFPLNRSIVEVCAKLRHRYFFHDNFLRPAFLCFLIEPLSHSVYTLVKKRYLTAKTNKKMPKILFKVISSRFNAILLPK